MRFHFPICLVIALTSIAPSWSKVADPVAAKDSRWIYLDTRTTIPDLDDVSFLEGAALFKQVGKRITLSGKRVPFWGGLTGIETLEKPHFGVSIDPVKIPKDGLVETTFTFNRYREHPSALKCHVAETGGSWFFKRIRLRVLEQGEMLNPYEYGALVTVTGTLCHVRVATAGSPPQKYFPPVPPSHFFFSIDDVVIKPMKPDLSSLQTRAIALDETTSAQSKVSDALSHYNRAVDFQINHEVQKATDEYKAAIELDNQMTPAWCNLGILLSEQRSDQEAIQALESAIQTIEHYGKDIATLRFLSLSRLAPLYSSEHKDELAESCYLRALLETSVKDKNAKMYADTLEDYCSFLRAHNKTADAEKLESEARQLRRLR